MKSGFNLEPSTSILMYLAQHRRISDEIRFRTGTFDVRFNMYLAHAQDGSLMKSGFESGTFDVRFNHAWLNTRRISDEIRFRNWNLSSDLHVPGSTYKTDL
ncbi:hypothetical protein AVEN_207267-1 [Araneus ventricosus]|uniref:Uncharacterized protein n=1 Tax=Araneus ventricosus TaxID=182803 RepID=A0A4Y2ID71_ARAVE|nr:hypothetical protein AVEN_207267-1 [Araneus ventricosus]